MSYRRLGKNGVMVSNICLGTMNFGWQTDEKASFEIMDRAVDLGINFFDTADVYGWGGEKGSTEEIIGRWINLGEGRRDSIVLATKVYNPMDRKGRRPEHNRDSRSLSAIKIIRHCNDSLRRLNTETIDLYQMHHIDRDCPVDEILHAMDILAKQGKIIYTGSSNFAGWDIATYCQEAKKRGFPGLVSEQSVYNLTQRTVELEVLPSCRYYGLGFISWSPLSGGLLAGVLGKPVSGRRGKSTFAAEVDKKRSQIEQYEALCKNIGEPPAVVGLAWLLHNQLVTSVIIGPRTVEQLNDSIRAAKFRIDQQTLRKLDEIFPGPGGEAPNAYAW
ncbi:MAG TPA: aldo/keto reductase [Fibrobacteres bacterium]|nr:aldo/keto reductase [Fibrobacterota bacterium]